MELAPTRTGAYQGGNLVPYSLAILALNFELTVFVAVAADTDHRFGGRLVRGDKELLSVTTYDEHEIRTSLVERPDEL